MDENFEIFHNKNCKQFTFLESHSTSIIFIEG